MHPGKMNSHTKMDAVGNSTMYKTFTTKNTLPELTQHKFTEKSSINWKELSEFPVLLSNQ